MIFDIKKWAHSKALIGVISVIGLLAVAGLVFQAGVFVGFHKASFLFKNGDNFYRAYGARDSRMMGGNGGMGMFNDQLSGGHGAIGKIVKVNLPNIVVIGPDNIEKTVITTASTSIREARDEKDIDDLSVDKFITVLGTPNDQGQVIAKFIRIIPAPTGQMNQMMNNMMGSSTRK